MPFQFQLSNVTKFKVRCFQCKKNKPASQFGKNKSSDNRLQANCRKCQSRNHVFKKYKMSHSEYRMKLKEQNWVCAICEKIDADPKNGKARRLAVDHNKNTGVNRGLLCRRCNVGLGYFLENQQSLRTAIRYLKKYESQDKRRK